MPNIFVISDTHFGHSNILKFKQPNGEPVRPFTTVEEMDEYMIERWNLVVRPQDKVYHLGDVAMRQSAIKTVARCNGKKRLVRGNHDVFKTRLYMEFFEEIYAIRVLDSIAFTHIPLHPESVSQRWRGNVHGHVHNSVPVLHYGPRYLNVSVEVINYTPVSLEDVKLMLLRQQINAEIAANISPHQQPLS